MDATLLAWLEEAVADARRRGLPELEPLLRSLARSTALLRAATWTDSVAARVASAPREKSDGTDGRLDGGQVR